MAAKAAHHASVSLLFPVFAKETYVRVTHFPDTETFFASLPFSVRKKDVAIRKRVEISPLVIQRLDSLRATMLRSAKYLVRALKYKTQFSSCIFSYCI